MVAAAAVRALLRVDGLADFDADAGPASDPPCPPPRGFFTCTLRTKRPWFGRQGKYSTSLTLPSFLPSAVSSSTPTQSPGANCVGPMKRTTPGFPPTSHRSPTLHDIIETELESFLLTHPFQIGSAFSIFTIDF